MFGDNFIIGERDVKIDNTRRLIIPSFSGIEKNEELVIQHFDGYAKLYSFRAYEQILNRYLELRNNANSLEDFEKYSAIIESICEKIDAILTTDAQKRITFPVNLMETLNFQIGDNIHFKGLGTSLSLRKK